MRSKARAEVWVVDDDRSLLQGVLALVADRGHVTRGFTDGRRALREVIATPPAVLVTDYEMPGLDGVSLARGVREALGGSSPRIFLVTGARLRRVDLTHFDHVLHKPFRFADLLTTIERALGEPRRRSSHQRLRRVTTEGKARASSDGE